MSARAMKVVLPASAFSKVDSAQPEKANRPLRSTAKPLTARQAVKLRSWMTDQIIEQAERERERVLTP